MSRLHIIRSLWRLGLAASLVLLCLFSTACLESTVTQTCEEIAEKQCSKCYSCSLPNLSGSALCDIADQETLSGCVQTFTTQCESQASALQGANDSLDACSTALDEQLDCSLLYEGAVQDHSHTVRACTLFL